MRGTRCVFWLTATLSCVANAQPINWLDMMRQGEALYQQDRLREAESAFQAALRNVPRTSASPITLGALLFSLAVVNHDLGKTQEAARFCQQAISVLKNSAGVGDPITQAAYAELGTLYIETGQLDTAEKLLSRVISALAGTSTTDTAPALRALDALSCIYAKRHNRKAAEKWLRSALSLPNTGSGQFYRANANLHLAFILDETNRSAEAWSHLEEATAIIQTISRPSPALRAQALLVRAVLDATAGRKDDADLASREAVVLVENFYGPDHRNTASVWLERALVLRRLNRKEEAKAAERQGQTKLAAQRQVNGLDQTVPLTALLPAR